MNSQTNMMNKRALLEERKKKWLSEREISLLQEEISQEVFQPRQLQIEQTNKRTNANIGGRSKLAEVGEMTLKRSSAETAESTDMFLSRLTEKLTVHIRDEVKREMEQSLLELGDNDRRGEGLREAVASKMEDFLQAELGSYTCKICFELMVSPTHTPTLLFPCGHTFCKSCIEMHLAKSNTNNRGCPYCRVRIDSKATNQSLKDLIDQFANQKSQIMSGSASNLKDVFPHSPSRQNKQNKNSHYSNNSNNDNNQNNRNNQSYHSDNNRSSSSSSRSRYVSQLKSCEMRYEILHNELEEFLLEQDMLISKKKKIKDATDHLLSEKNKIDSKISLLLEEKELINSHLTNQDKKNSELHQQEMTIKERVELVRNTIENVQCEMDKLKLLVQGVTEMES
eukprot:gene9337-12581_t